MPTPEEIEAKVREALYDAAGKELPRQQIELLELRVKTIRQLNTHTG